MGRQASMLPYCLKLSDLQKSTQHCPTLEALLTAHSVYKRALLPASYPMPATPLLRVIAHLRHRALIECISGAETKANTHSLCSCS